MNGSFVLSTPNLREKQLDWQEILWTGLSFIFVTLPFMLLLFIMSQIWMGGAHVVTAYIAGILKNR